MISICIPSYNAEKTIRETIESSLRQNYPNIEIIVFDDCSTDNTYKIAQEYPIKVFKSEKNSGKVGPTMNKCVKAATGEYIMFLCSDDYFVDPNVASDVVRAFSPDVGYVGRWYYQFLDPDPRPVRAHRSNDPYFQADNPSGLAFRKSALEGDFSTEYWIEAACMVKRVLKNWDYEILKYDTCAVRIHNSGATKAYCYESSPMLSWMKIAKRDFVLTAFVSLIQYKNWGKYKFMLREAWYFIKYRPVNLLRWDFWFFFLISVFTPKCILRPLTQGYKNYFLKHFIKKVYR